MTCEVVKDETCVYLPREWIRIREHLNPVYQSICDVLLYSGMRVEEFWWFVDHPESFKPSRRCISLPKDAIKKTETKYKSRDVLLPIKGCDAVQHLIDMKLTAKKLRVSREAMGQALKRAAEKSGVGKMHICPKAFRKTYISWLSAIYKDSPGRCVWINASAGHTSDIQLNNYLATSFEPRDVDDMRVEMKGWGFE